MMRPPSRSWRHFWPRQGVLAMSCNRAPVSMAARLSRTPASASQSATSRATPVTTRECSRMLSSMPYSSHRAAMRPALGNGVWGVKVSRVSAKAHLDLARRIAALERAHEAPQHAREHGGNECVNRQLLAVQEQHRLFRRRGHRLDPGEQEVGHRLGVVAVDDRQAGLLAASPPPGQGDELPARGQEGLRARGHHLDLGDARALEALGDHQLQAGHEPGGQGAGAGPGQAGGLQPHPAVVGQGHPVGPGRGQALAVLALPLGRGGHRAAVAVVLDHSHLDALGAQQGQQLFHQRGLAAARGPADADNRDHGLPSPHIS
eukprot:TRINITY_DN5708_c0_g2_i1.p2 TRINITY_DN5708_c0_g2~~TRINITY_DN5708_c0_g2_i1.p2  ORF type:complete len:318 (-),score=107.90 TRINITY_DN5708_c0_g2_i1:21-974(-)